MRPISEETIAQIDSFVFKLTNNQLEEWLKDYKKEQYNLVTYFEQSRRYFENPLATEYVLRMFNLQTRCFQTYDVNLPLILKSEFDNMQKEWIRYIMSQPKGSNMVDTIIQYGIDIKQPNLTIYILKKLSESEDKMT